MWTTLVLCVGFAGLAAAQTLPEGCTLNVS
jgi:hypothetical protein